MTIYRLKNTQKLPSLTLYFKKYLLVAIIEYINMQR